MLWQKSPQYANMPHADYMRTEEGKRSQQAFQQWDQWRQNNMPTPSKPGPGRPSVPMQPQGMTPSKPGAGRPSVPMTQSYSPGQAKPQQSPYATATPYGAPQVFNKYGPGTSPEYMQQNPDTEPFNPAGNRPAGIQRPAMLPMPEPGLRQLATQGPNGEPRGLPRPRHSPNDTLASGGGQPANRPPPFQATTQNFDGTTSQMPNFQQRDAFIAKINNQLGQMQQQSWQQPGMGAPQFNFPQMWGQAGQMAQQGFRNPFAIPAGQQGALAPLSQPGGPAGAGRLHSGFPQMAGDIVPGAVGQPMSPQMLDLLRQRPGVVF